MKKNSSNKNNNFLFFFVFFIIFSVFIINVQCATKYATTTKDDVRKEYRSLDGHGNNIKSPKWGTKEDPHIRQQMPAAYYKDTFDGIDPALINPRHVSNRMVETAGKYKPNDVLLNHMHVDWGHLVTVDLLNTANRFPFDPAATTFPMPAGDFWFDSTHWGSAMDDGCTNKDPQSGECLTDGAYSGCEKKAPYIAYPRQLPFTGDISDGTPPDRSPKKHKGTYGDTTQWLDASFIYGTPLDTQKVFGSPFLQIPEPFEHDANGNMLNWGKFPIDKEIPWRLPLVPFVDNKWIVAGDFRINKTPGLRLFHIMFMLEHNRRCDELRSHHSNWSNETLFHEARRMVIGLFQSITVREYLAAATGEPLPAYRGYNASVNPNIDEFFAHVAMRYGHSALPSLTPLLDNDLNPCPWGALHTRDAIFTPVFWETPDYSDPFPYDPVTKKNSTKLKMKLDLPSVARGLSHSLGNNVDLGFIDDIRNFMGLVGGPRHGDDLISFDVFRAADVGIPDYNSARQYLGLPKVTSFDQITPDVPVQALLKELYGTVDNINPYVGAMAEAHIPGAELGPTHKASLQEQFLRLRNGDRFWFENPEMFTEEEIEEIHRTKLRDLLLRHFPSISNNSLPVSAFFLDQRQLTAFKPDKEFPDPDIHPDGLPWTTRQLSPAYRLHWAIDRKVEPRPITIQIQVATEGWAGIGFSPDAFGSMKGADIILCRIYQDQPECRDSKALDVGIPTLDTDISGRSTIRNVTVRREDGILTAIFTRDLTVEEGEENYDKLIGDQTRIIFAFHPTQNALVYHGPTRNPDVVVDFDLEYKGPPERIPLNTGVVVILYIASAIGVILALVYGGLVLTKPDYFRFQTPEFCYLVLFGAILCYISVLLLLPDSQNDATCKTHIWLFGMSFWIVFLGFFIKVARVYYIITTTAKTLEVKVVPFWHLLVPLAFFMILEMIYDILWIVLLPPNLDSEVTEVKDKPWTVEYVEYCAGNKYMWLGSVAFRACFLVVGVILAMMTRRMPQEFNWSREISLSIWTMAIILGISIPLGFALSGTSNMVVMLKGICICLAYIGVTSIMVMDSVKRIIFGKGAREQSKATHSVSRVGTTSGVH